MKEVRKRRSVRARTAPATRALLAKLGARCKAIRIDEGLTQVEVAEKARISLSYLQVVERGTDNPSMAIVAALARVYRMFLSCLLHGVDDR